LIIVPQPVQGTTGEFTTAVLESTTLNIR